MNEQPITLLLDRLAAGEPSVEERLADCSLQQPCALDRAESTVLRDADRARWRSLEAALAAKTQQALAARMITVANDPALEEDSR